MLLEFNFENTFDLVGDGVELGHEDDEEFTEIWVFFEGMKGELETSFFFKKPLEGLVEEDLGLSEIVGDLGKEFEAPVDDFVVVGV